MRFDPTKVSILVGAHKVIGIVPGTFIEIAMKSDHWTYHKSGDGSPGLRVKDPDKSATVTLTLMQNSDSNRRLQKYLTNSRNDSGQDSFSLSIVNNQGGESAHADVCWVMKEPDLGFSGGGDGTDRVWTLETGNMNLKLDANYTENPNQDN